MSDEVIRIWEKKSPKASVRYDTSKCWKDWGQALLSKTVSVLTAYSISIND